MRSRGREKRIRRETDKQTDRHTHTHTYTHTQTNTKRDKALLTLFPPFLGMSDVKSTSMY